MHKAGEYLADVTPAEAFQIYDGSYIRNLNELLAKIEAMSPDAFRHHVNPPRDDFRPWIESSVGDRILANSLAGVTDKRQYTSIIRKRIKRLEIAESLIKASLYLGSKAKRKAIQLGPILVFTLIIFMLVQIGYLGRLHQQTFQRINQVDEKMTHFITKQISADNVLFLHLMGVEHLLNLSINKTTFALESNFSNSPFLFPQPKPPINRVSRKDILVSNRTVAIFIKSPQWAEIADTKSMEPVLSKGSYAIGIAPESPEDVQVGDIVSYLDAYNDTVIHRIMEVGYDDLGWFAITKGDANLYEDPFKVRFQQVKRVVVAIVY